MKTTFLPGKISIGRPSGDGCDYISIYMTDESSGVRFVEVRVPYAGFAQALTGMGYVDCSFETRGTHLIGSTFEHKEMVIPHTASYRLDRNDTAKLDALLVPYEIEGWKGDRSDLVNGHRSSPEGQRVNFRRYVNAKGEPIL